MMAEMLYPWPGQLFWSCMTGAAVAIAGITIFLNRKVKLAATLLGVLILLFGLVVWVTRLIAHPEDVGGAKYLIDLGLAGGALLLAGALPRKGD
ncbi:hypothetical protein [Acidobacterium sp. S8]|uniref:hypothetical protein n=1 Tax=Acidobacterium sp. S8 TaxID=1641854 RepID=UPI0015754605|nr:hypothetical protein [Acidobacterium sp. S8]